MNKLIRRMLSLKRLLILTFIFFYAVLFRNWFSLNNLGGNDFFPFSSGMLHELSFVPSAWNNNANNGFGDNVINLLWTGQYVNFLTFLLVNKLGFNWQLIIRFFWLFPYILFSILSPYLLLNILIPKNPIKKALIFLGVVVFSLNSYILMLISGGQINQSIAYVIIPLLIFIQLKIVDTENFQNKKLLFLFISNALINSLLVYFDFRFFLLSLVISVIIYIYSILKSKTKKTLLINFFVFYLIEFSFILFIHAYWIIPSFVSKEYTSVFLTNTTFDWLRFLSFAKFSQTILLLHPNWPENIFGKLYFTRPEFFIYPTISFFSIFLLFDEKIKSTFRNVLLSFLTIGFLGIFLSKGVEEPFGFLYKIFYDRFPLFNLFRDPTKFYTFTAISFFVLLPLGVFYISEKLRLFTWYFTKSKKYSEYASKSLILLTSLILLIIVTPIFTSNRFNSFQAEDLPKDYATLEKFIQLDNSFSRILYVPRRNKYAPASSLHPAVDADRLFKTSDYKNIQKVLRNDTTADFLRGLGVGYVIIPNDFNEMIFLTDRKYDDKLRQQLIDSINSVSEYKKINQFKNDVQMYKLDQSQNLFSLQNGGRVEIVHSSPTRYALEIDNSYSSNFLIFLESYSHNWLLKYSNSKKDILPSKQKNLFNKYPINITGHYQVELIYSPQKYVEILYFFSLTFSVVACIYILLYIVNYLRSNQK